jgi:stress-induced morphogen
MKHRIEEKLQKNLNPNFLEVKNNSHLHAGHMGDNGTGETHFAVLITAEELKNISAVNAHRKVNSLLKDEFEKGLHALEIKIVN